ncbi:dihydrodipicolinate synthase family protein [Flavobacterium sufflavum]|uniref:Dihydrodipicolinate synthase family protein n=1 Tax=Flavobacterium sufflavum TaxID=1921138 RepID=A0A3S2WG64_9FLAO|nr:dihydrodipicolinate synthase family protein [Flavobacterium sufflavum]RVT78530.1 dihydrodipicolinate synthase family protein [Flavobacterium sufflavum]
MKNIKKYHGVVVPMVTPLSNDLSIDLDAVTVLVNHLIDGGCHPFVLGTTGESSSVSFESKVALVKKTVEVAKGKATIYAGISGNCFQESLDQAKVYTDLGVDVLVAHVPYYYPLSQNHILNYFNQLASAVSLPLIVYNMPMTTNMSIDLEIVDTLSKHPNIVGYKESERGEERMAKAIGLWKYRENFSYLLGWAVKSYEGMLLGADGLVPSTGNLTPQLYNTIYESVLSGNNEAAQKAQEKSDAISKVYQENQIVTNAIPILKTMLAHYNLCKNEVLLPMIKVNTINEQEIQAKINELGKDLKGLNSIE